MKILNLVYPEKSDIKYKISKFPDGQNQLTILDKTLLNEYIEIKTRINNFIDLEILICAVKSLKGLNVRGINLYSPYILGSRSDRKFEEGSNNYLKDVICPILNSLNFYSITCLDPHSDVLEACIKSNFLRISNEEVVKFALSEIYDYDSNEGNSRMVLISPDAGASKKIYKVAESFEFEGDIIICSKERDKDGKLTKCVVPLSNLGNKDLIIIDDICDGGATFINIAKEIKDHYIGNSCPKIYLIVTHGIFSKGYEELSKYFDGIYCTNSYNDIPKYNEYDGISIGSKILKQLNIF